jgi:predicted DNA-binding transcriptional regulator AlpA
LEAIMDGDDYLPAPKVLKRYGISAPTLYRWTRNPTLQFPQPIKIGAGNGRLFYRVAELVEWERKRAFERGARTHA